MGSPHYGVRYGGWAHLKLSIPRRERFLVPIRATGGGALLDMPDELDFGLSPVKYESPKTIMDARPALEAKFWDLENPRKNVQNTGNIRTWEAFSEAKEKTEVWRWSRFDDRTERAPHFHRCNRGKSRGIASFLGSPAWSMSMIIVAQEEMISNALPEQF